MTVVPYHALLAWLDLGDARSYWLWTGPLCVLTDGEAAVLLFFVLSGIALSWGSFHGGPDPFTGLRPTAAWLLARTVRICGPYLATLALMAVARTTLWDAAPTTPSRSSWFHHHGNVPATAENVLHDLLLPAQYPRLVAQGWSLTEEMRFAFLLPLLLPVAARSTAVTVVCLLLATVSAGLSRYVVYFAAGILIAKHWKELQCRLRSLSASESSALAVAGLALYSFARWGPWHLSGVTRAIETVIPSGDLAAPGAALLLIVPMASPGIRRLLESHALQWLGRVSFSLYLVHLLPVFYLSPRIIRVLNGQGIGDPFFIAVLSAAAVVVCSLPLAWIFHRWVESPCTLLARRIVSPSGPGPDTPSGESRPQS
ncbi:MAG: acyltransferase [Verrucomicrobiae bacterium]|nr:acyltransferase [Verrucomicrobiae bacterium]